MSIHRKVIGVAIACASLPLLPLAGPAAAAKRDDKMCGGHYQVYFGHTYKGTDSWQWKGWQPTPAEVKRRTEAPLGVTAKFYRDQQGYPWVDVRFTATRASKIRPLAGEKTGYNLKITSKSAKVSMKPEYHPSTIVGGKILSPDDAGWKKAVESQVSGYTFTFHKHYELEALDCPGGSQVPKRLLQKDTFGVVERNENGEEARRGELINIVDLKLES
ncbi:hypothetical protein ACQEU3_41880 [Spirillospora sp. CA-253888]